MFKTIVWATDGSEHADLALPYVKALAQKEGAQIVIVHSEEIFVSRSGGYPLKADEDDLQAKIKRQAEELSGEGIPTTVKVMGGLAGGAAHTIAAAASEVHADAIVLGTRGHTQLGGLLVGSVTQRLLHIAPCPVLVVPAQSRSVGTEEDVATAEAT